MIIDLILDRKDDEESKFPINDYSADEFFRNVYRNDVIFDGIGKQILDAMAFGSEAEVKRALCSYIDDQDYNPEIKHFVNSVNWL